MIIRQDKTKDDKKSIYHDSSGFFKKEALYCLVIVLRCGGIVMSRLGFVVVFVFISVSVSVSFSLFVASGLVLPLSWSSLVLTRYTKLRFPSPISVTIRSAHVIVSSPPTRIPQRSGWHSTYALTYNTRQS